MFSIPRYINDTNFQIVYMNNSLNIVNYEKINYMEDDKISLSVKDKIIQINGDHLRVTKLLDNEIMVVGNFSSVLLKD